MKFFNSKIIKHKQAIHKADRDKKFFEFNNMPLQILISFDSISNNNINLIIAKYQNDSNLSKHFIMFNHFFQFVKKMFKNCKLLIILSTALINIVLGLF